MTIPQLLTSTALPQVRPSADLRSPVVSVTLGVDILEGVCPGGEGPWPHPAQPRECGLPPPPSASSRKGLQPPSKGRSLSP